jgi:DNA modification methylase
MVERTVKAMKLTENEKRDVVKYLEAGKPLPEKYRFLLFEDAREVELLWNGKSSEVTNTVLPFQVIEQIDEPRSDEKFGRQATLFDDSGRQLTGWTNKLIWGDNRLILSALKNGPMRKEIETQGGLKLVYIDPPFDVGADFSMDITIGDGKEEESFKKKPSVIEEIAYRDTWGKGADSFISMIYERIILIHDLLAEDGSIFVHCDWRLSSHMRLVLDEIFGKQNFVNEIIWAYFGPGTDKSKEFTKKHDTIYYYAKNKGSHIFNDGAIRVEHSAKTKDNYKKGLAGSGFAAESINSREKEAYSEDTNLNKLGKIPEDWWEMAIAARYPVDGVKRTGYPTEKPLPLLERIIKVASNEGDLVADFFVGSGTTLAVSEMLGRKWIGTDLGRFGIHTSRKRMIDVQRKLKKEGVDFRAFEILNVGRYERENFLNVNEDLRAEEKAKQAARKEKEFVQLIIAAYKAEPVESFVNIVGKKRDRLVAVGPISTPVSSKQVQDIVAECKDKAITKIDILGFDYEMGLDFQEYNSQGIDVAFRVIPREVFDKKAIERGHVKFYDVSFVEVKPTVKGPVNKKELSVELTDFSVSYNQDDSGEIAEALRPGGAKVIVENGQVVKVSKDKDSDIISKEVLTKKWSDWIDYWAVDFDFASRKEIIKVIEDGEEKEVWTGDFIFDNEWQSFRTKKNRELELTSVSKEVSRGKYKVAIKVVDIFGNDTTRVIEVEV